jgi:hypothetical protein
MARGRGGPTRVLARRQPVRGRPAPRHRHRVGRRRRGTCTGIGRGHVLRAGADARSDRHHCDHRRLQGIADARRATPRQARHSRRGGRPDRRARAIRRSGARRSLRSPGNPRGGGREVRGPAQPASTAGRARTATDRSGACPDSRSGSQGHARAVSRTALTGSGTGSGTCPYSRSRSRSGSGDARPEHLFLAGRRSSARDSGRVAVVRRAAVGGGHPGEGSGGSPR